MRFFNLRPFGHEIDGVFALQSFNVGRCHIDCDALAACVGRNLYNSNFTSVPCAVGIWAVKHHMNLERAVAAGSKVEAKRCAVVLLCAGEGFYTLGVFVKSAETEVFESDNTAVLDAGKIHAVVPYVVVYSVPSEALAVHSLFFTYGS